jgi:hypothetical protein
MDLILFYGSYPFTGVILIANPYYFYAGNFSGL